MKTIFASLHKVMVTYMSGSLGELENYLWKHSPMAHVMVKCMSGSLGELENYLWKHSPMAHVSQL